MSTPRPDQPAQLLVDTGGITAIHDSVLQVYPEEGCGFVLEDTEDRLRVVPVRNRSTDRRTFEADLGPLLAVQMKGWKLRGIFHSHPDGEAQLSERDQAGALVEHERGLFVERYPGVVYIVVAVRGPVPEVVLTRMYRWIGDAGRFEEIATVP